MHIVQIEGPEVVKAGAELRLDCDYDYMAEEQPQLDLKWYFNGRPIPVNISIALLAAQTSITKCSAIIYFKRQLFVC